MTRTLWLVLAIVTSILLIGCGDRQSAQPVTQQVPQPLVGDQPAPAAQQVEVSPQAGPPQIPMPQGVPAQAPPAVEQPANNRTAALAQPPARYERTHDERAEAAPRESERPPAEAQRPPAAITIPAGTALDVRLQETIDTKRNRAGDRFDATLTRAIVVDRETVVPRGTPFGGHLIESRPSGRLKGHAELSLSLDSFELNGRRYEIRTTHVARASGGHKKRNWTLIGGGSGLGTALGAIAGGPAGALIGAGAGAGAGTAGAVFTGKKNVRLPVETPLAFTLREPVSLPN